MTLRAANSLQGNLRKQGFQKGTRPPNMEADWRSEDWRSL